MMGAKSCPGSDLIVIEEDEIPDRLVSRIAIRSDREVMLCFKPACIDAADVVE